MDAILPVFFPLICYVHWISSYFPTILSMTCTSSKGGRGLMPLSHLLYAFVPQAPMAIHSVPCNAYKQFKNHTAFQHTLKYIKNQKQSYNKSWKWHDSTVSVESLKIRQRLKWTKFKGKLKYIPFISFLHLKHFLKSRSSFGKFSVSLLDYTHIGRQLCRQSWDFLLGCIQLPP